jgi:ParB-like chromosome segregation protein Spo0J
MEQRAVGEVHLVRPRPDNDSSTEWVDVDALLPADSPRREGEDQEHIRMLAEVEGRLPPIVVHRATMRVIDGMHRLGAAALRGDRQIEVRYFDGSAEDAFVLAVQTNIAHGMPLSAADRTTAAERIIASHPVWSDRAVAAATGLGARTVAGIRRRVRAQGDGGEPAARMGRDGRVRPVDSAEGRRRASEVIRQQPGASLRTIARAAGVSPSTARDVRRRMERGEDPVPRGRGETPRSDGSVAGLPVERGGPTTGTADLVRGLMSDPALKFSESGRALLRWISSRAIHAAERRDVAGAVPPHCSYLVANLARQCADEWLLLAADLEQRVDRVA